ncbi:glycoside hydrolase family 108 protein [Comamonas jiangduensis]|uniref:glycoside hydrolase family 108 protein n=1 Tax=Comamonas jiangduensis TaxID=1194168 RepID=UPI003BF8D5B0
MQHKWRSIGVLMAAVVGSVLTIEGGYVNDPNDAGGATNHGITEQVAREHGYTGPMQSLPKGMATDIYIGTYIQAPRFDGVLRISPAVGTELVDSGVNADTGRAARWFQQSVNDLSRYGRDYPMITVDGVIGTSTLDAYRSLEKKRGRIKACELTLKLMDSYQAAHYAKLAQSKANASFIVGWLDHRIGNVPPSRCTETVGEG